MISTTNVVHSPDVLCKNLRSTHKEAHQLPKYSLTLETLRVLECSFLKKGLITPRHGAVTPLSHIAETERNVFLWRNELSISKASEFEFWFDIPKLIEKRREQLKRSHDQNNPFFSPIGSTVEGGIEVGKEDLAYLTEFQQAFDRIAIHASALSSVALWAEEQLTPDVQGRERVVLPVPNPNRSLTASL